MKRLDKDMQVYLFEDILVERLRRAAVLSHFSAEEWMAWTQSSFQLGEKACTPRLLIFFFCIGFVLLSFSFVFWVFFISKIATLSASLIMLLKRSEPVLS